MTITPTPPDPTQEPEPAAPLVRLSAMQAHRASMMQHTVGAEYQQPAHTFLADKLPESPELHRQVVLPGARKAIHLDLLEQMQAQGLDQSAIVAQVNGVLDEALRPRTDQFEAWRDGELADRIARARERESRRIELFQARQAEVERRLDEELA